MYEIHPCCCVYQEIFLFIVSVTFNLPLPIVVLTSEFNFVPLGQLDISSCFPPTPHLLVSLPKYSSVSLLPSTAQLFKDCLHSLPPSISSPPTSSLHGNLAPVPTSKPNCSCQEHLLAGESHEHVSIFISFGFSPVMIINSFLEHSFCFVLIALNSSRILHASLTYPQPHTCAPFSS